jgi:hypothetical protein
MKFVLLLMLFLCEEILISGFLMPISHPSIVSIQRSQLQRTVWKNQFRKPLLDSVSGVAASPVVNDSPSLKLLLQKDMMTAVKSKDSVKLGCVRTVINAIKQKEIEDMKTIR